MIYGIIVLLAVGICYLGVRYRLLKNVVRDTREQLEGINKEPEESRILRLSVPDYDFEELLVEMNHTLQEVREKKIAYEKRERQFKQQIENISHDLRTPLTSMIGYLKIMDTDGLSEEEKEDLRTVLRKAENLQELIAQFYDFTRLTAQDYPLQIEKIDISRILREVLADMYADLTEQKLTMDIQMPDKPVLISGNDNALRRVFQNLLQNAGRYAASTLTIAVMEEQGQANICFKNDTNGLTERDVEQLFERFYTVDRARSNGSTGLGLTIAKELVEKMGGSIEAKLDEGRWLTIKIKCLY